MLLYQDGTGGISLENEFWELCCFCPVFAALWHLCYTASVNGTVEIYVTFAAASWSSVFLCSHDLLPELSSSVAMELLTKLEKWLQSL